MFCAATSHPHIHSEQERGNSCLTKWKLAGGNDRTFLYIRRFLSNIQKNKWHFSEDWRSDFRKEIFYIFFRSLILIKWWKTRILIISSQGSGDWWLMLRLVQTGRDWWAGKWWRCSPPHLVGCLRSDIKYKNPIRSDQSRLPPAQSGHKHHR